MMTMNSKQLLALFSLAFLFQTAWTQQTGSTSSNGMGLGLLNGLNASSFGWDANTLSKARQQLSQWVSSVQKSATSSLKNFPLAERVLSASGTTSGGRNQILDFLGLGNRTSVGGGNVLRDMVQSVQDSLSGQTDRSSTSGSSSGLLSDLLGGGQGLDSLLGGGQQGSAQKLLNGGLMNDRPLADRLRSTFGGSAGSSAGSSAESLLTQLLGGRDLAENLSKLMQQSAGNIAASGSSNKASQGAGGSNSNINSLADQYYSKASGN